MDSEHNLVDRYLILCKLLFEIKHHRNLKTTFASLKKRIASNTKIQHDKLDFISKKLGGIDQKVFEKLIRNCQNVTRSELIYSIEVAKFEIELDLFSDIIPEVIFDPFSKPKTGTKQLQKLCDFIDDRKENFTDGEYKQALEYIALYYPIND